jgi:malate/lactate dehydrogenase
MTARIAIVGGGGGVGSSLAFNLLLRPEPYDVALVDGHSGMARSHEMDLQQVVAAGASGSIRVVAPPNVLGADVVVVTAAAPLTVNRSRMVYLRDNAAVVRTVTDVIATTPGWPGTLIVVTNPVDPLCTWIQAELGLDRRRVLGYTANDGLRLRTAIGDALGVASSRVDAWVIGEHGDGCVPLLDRVRVDGEPIDLSESQRRAADDFVRGWYVRHVALDSGRSSTWTSGHGIARMVAALLGPPAPEPWPASVVLEGEYGIEGVAVSVPVTLGDGGATQVHEWELTPEQAAALRAGADVVRSAVASLGTVSIKRLV